MIVSNWTPPIDSVWSTAERVVMVINGARVEGRLRLASADRRSLTVDVPWTGRQLALLAIGDPADGNYRDKNTGMLVKVGSRRWPPRQSERATEPDAPPRP
jgi:hypothetical protein